MAVGAVDTRDEEEEVDTMVVEEEEAVVTAVRGMEEMATTITVDTSMT